MKLSENFNSNDHNAVIVIIGSTPGRRDQLVELLNTLGKFSVYGTFSEDEGVEKIKTLSRVDLVIISTRYTEGQRKRIHKFIHETTPLTRVSEPGWDYPYKDEDIAEDVKEKLGL